MSKFSVENYLFQLKRCDIHTLDQLSKTMGCDLEMPELKKLCQHFNTSAAGIVKKIAQEIGL